MCCLSLAPPPAGEDTALPSLGSGDLPCSLAPNKRFPPDFTSSRSDRAQSIPYKAPLYTKMSRCVELLERANLVSMVFNFPRGHICRRAPLFTRVTAEIIHGNRPNGPQSGAAFSPWDKNTVSFVIDILLPFWPEKRKQKLCHGHICRFLCKTSSYGDRFRPDFPRLFASR